MDEIWCCYHLKKTSMTEILHSTTTTKNKFVVLEFLSLAFVRGEMVKLTLSVKE